MDSLSTNNPDDQPQDQPSQPVPEPAPQPAAAPQPAPQPPATQMDDELTTAPKIDLLSSGANATTAAAPPAPAPQPSHDLASYEAADAAAVAQPAARPQVAAQTAAKPRHTALLWTGIGIVLVVLLAGGGFWYVKQRQAASPAAASPSPSNVAVTTPSPSPSATPTPSETPSATPTPSASPAPVLNVTVGGTAVADGGQATALTNRPAFAGSAAPGATITITLAPENVSFTAAASSSGAWSAVPDSDLPNGDHTVTVSDGTSQIGFSLTINPGSTSSPNLAETGDPVMLVSLAAALMLVISLAGLRLAGRRD